MGFGKATCHKPVFVKHPGRVYPSRYYPFPKRQILDLSKLKELADDNFIFDENDRKLSKRVENTVGRGEIACCEQFLLFPQYFQKASTADM